MMQNPFPQISICIPAYKAKDFILETLNSIHSQTYTDWELIIVEDGLDDGTEEIVKRTTANWKQRVSYIKHEINKGLSRSRNTANDNAAGRWIAILDADDLWTPNHLENLIRLGESEHLDMVFSGSEIFLHDSREILGHRSAPDGMVSDIGKKIYLGELIIQPSSSLIRKRVFEKLGNFDTKTDCNDFEFWLRMASHHLRIGGVSDFSCLYRKHDRAMSSDSAKLSDDVGRICFKYRKKFNLTPSQRKRAAQHEFSSSRIARKHNILFSIKTAIRGVYYYICN